MRTETVTKTVLRLLSGPVVRGLVNAFALKGATIALTFAVITLAAWQLDKHDFGVFSMLYSAAGLFSLLSTSGQQVLVVRTWNEYVAQNDPGRLKGALIFGMATLLAGLILIASVFLIVLGQLQPWPLAWAVSRYLLMFGLVQFSGHLVRAAIGVGPGDGLANILTMGLPVGGLLFHFATASQAGLKEIFLLFPIGSAIALAIHAVLIRNRLETLFPRFWNTPTEMEPATWAARSAKLWLFNALEAVNQFLDVLLVGVLLNPVLAGAYFVITRLANLFTVAWGAMYFYVSRHVPRLYFQRELDQLDHHLNVLAALLSALLVAGLALLIGGGGFLLSIFNADYAVYAPALATLSLGTAAILAAGASGPLLTFTGHEGRSTQIIAIVVAVRLTGFFLLIPVFQIGGAVAATTLSFILMGVLLRQSARRLTGIDGSVLRLLAFLPKPRVQAAPK